MKKLGKSVIHDEGFQFFLTIKIKFEIENLIKAINTFEDCIKHHEKCKKEEWYNSKVTFGIYNTVYGYRLGQEFTLLEAKKIRDKFKIKYDLLMDLCEDSLSSAIESYNKDKEYQKPYIEDLDRIHVIVDETVQD